jgi:hypothetical protein
MTSKTGSASEATRAAPFAVKYTAAEQDGACARATRVTRAPALYRTWFFISPLKF